MLISEMAVLVKFTVAKVFPPPLNVADGFVQLTIPVPGVSVKFVLVVKLIGTVPDKVRVFPGLGNTRVRVFVLLEFKLLKKLLTPENVNEPLVRVMSE